MPEEKLNFTDVAIYRIGMFGVHRTDCKTLALQTGQKYAQYNNAVKYQFQEKGKRKAAACVLADRSPWMRVVKLAKAPQPANPMEAIGGGATRSKYTSYDMRYITEFEDLLAASGAEVVWGIGEGHRGPCDCGLCAGRMRESAEAAFDDMEEEDDPFIASLPL